MSTETSTNAPRNGVYTYNQRIYNHEENEVYARTYTNEESNEADAEFEDKISETYDNYNSSTFFDSEKKEIVTLIQNKFDKGSCEQDTKTSTAYGIETKRYTYTEYIESNEKLTEDEKNVLLKNGWEVL
jgi:hypothetical protein